MDPARFVFLDETGTATNMARRYGRSPSGARLVAAVPHGHVWTPPLAQGGSSDRLARDRVLPCVRPLMRRYVVAAGPYGSSRVRSTSLERARSARHAPGSPDPASPTLRHTCPSTSSPRRQPHLRRSLMWQRLELGRSRPWQSVPRPRGRSCLLKRRSPASAACARACAQARSRAGHPCAWPSARRRWPRR